MRSIFFLALASHLFGQTPAAPPVPPEQIEQELLSGEAQYQRAKEMFNPWYTGPLITPSASMMPPGSANIQPYLFVTGTYARYDSHRHSVPLNHNQYSVQVVTPLQVGITDTMDLVFSPAGQVARQEGHTGGGFSDLSCTFGFPILRQTLYIPGLKFTVSETFPTGKYKNLDPLTLDSTGGGSFQTRFGLTTSKIIWWTYPYPMNTRLFIGYTVPFNVHVTNYNSYGGGIGTDGHVKPGHILTLDLGLEMSITQNWVLSMDVAYTAQGATHFYGIPGQNSDGSPATVGGGYNDNLSLAPAIEYNWNENLGIIAGSQFSVYGRNSANFINGQLSVIYTW